MNENLIRELGTTLVQKQIDLAKLKRDKKKVSEIVNLESEILKLRREFNNELDKISGEGKVTIVSTE